MSTNNNFQSLKSILKERYSKGPKAKSEEEATRNPKKFLKKMKEPSIKKLKGIAL